MNLPSDRSWKTVFKEDYMRKFEVSEQEYNEYLSTSHIIYLQQACEKMFSVVENYLMVKYERRKRSYKELMSVLRQGLNSNDSSLLADAYQLHIFFYNGETDFDRYTIEVKYKEVLSKMKKRLDS